MPTVPRLPGSNVGATESRVERNCFALWWEVSS